MPATELGKSLSKLMIPVILFEKFSSETFITSIKVFYVTKHSGKSYKLKDIHSIRGKTWNIAIQKRKIYNIKIKVIALIMNFGGNKTIRNR